MTRARTLACSLGLHVQSRKEFSWSLAYIYASCELEASRIGRFQWEVCFDGLSALIVRARRGGIDEELEHASTPAIVSPALYRRDYLRIHAISLASAVYRSTILFPPLPLRTSCLFVSGCLNGGWILCTHAHPSELVHDYCRYCKWPRYTSCGRAAPPY
jgi:hypothetical protein